MKVLSKYTMGKYCMGVIIMVSVSGCVTSTVQQIRETQTSMTDGDSVVIIGRRNRPSQAEAELDFIDCVAKNVGSGSNSLQVVSEQQFVDALFPWFEPRTAPLNTNELPELLQQPLLAERLRQIGLKYLVWVEGSTQRTAQSGTLSCSATPGGAGCFGFLTWDSDSSYEASIWDAHTAKTAGRVSTDASGTSYIPAIVIPIPIIARVQSSACNGLANQLKQFVQNG
ncbi:MAG: hypothetical protein GXP16_04215 [Gammaproteobacteria bacterium]|nr:hypothetical protein [Gammaproteobacteria bacterium]